MKINLNKKQLKTLIISSVCVIFGVLFCILSGKMIDFLKTAFCVIALAYGVFYLISYTVLSFDEKNSSTLYQSVVAIALVLSPLHTYKPANLPLPFIVTFAVLSSKSTLQSS